VLNATVFLLSAAFAVYVVFGYPVLLGLLARLRPRPVHKQPQLKTVSVLLPVRNGEAWLGQKLESILALDYPRELLQIIVISDGSTDGTEAAARAFASQGVELISIPQSGKATALNEGMRRARGEILFFTDVRQKLDPAALGNLVACFADPRVGVASGELIILRGGTLEEANVGLYWRYEKWIRKCQSRLDSVVGATGCIYAMRASLAGPLAADTILDDVNLPLRAFFQGYRVILDGTARAYDHPTSLGSEFRRKVRTLAGVYQTIGQYPALLGPRNRVWIHFISHKLGRLLLPWALLMALAASFGLPAYWRKAALCAQAAVLALALLDVVLPDRFPLKRLTSPVRTALVLIAASFCAAFFLILPRRNLWQPTKVNVSQAQTAPNREE
jgi:cellulose synthase/poly-beta-1,6-N-acetylglucosamine synthase-like glycosyltransferase